MKIQFESCNADFHPQILWGLIDIVDDCQDDSLLSVYERIKGFFGKDSPFKIGHGGHHIWIALKSSDERVVLITEEKKICLGTEFNEEVGDERIN